MRSFCKLKKFHPSRCNFASSKTSRLFFAFIITFYPLFFWFLNLLFPVCIPTTRFVTKICSVCARCVNTKSQKLGSLSTSPRHQLSVKQIGHVCHGPRAKWTRDGERGLVLWTFKTFAEEEHQGWLEKLSGCRRPIKDEAASLLPMPGRLRTRPSPPTPHSLCALRPFIILLWSTKVSITSVWTLASHIPRDFFSYFFVCFAITWLFIKYMSVSLSMLLRILW